MCLYEVVRWSWLDDVVEICDLYQLGYCVGTDLRTHLLEGVLFIMRSVTMFHFVVVWGRVWMQLI